jgi:uncharacterized membrane protein YkoI
VHHLNHERILMSLSKTFAGVAGLAACALVGAAVATGAGSATKGSTTTSSTTATAETSHTPEAALAGDVATKAKAAAVAKVGGTADSATTEDDGSNAAAAYEVHVTKSDGSHVTVILDSSYAVLSVESRTHDGHHGRGGGNGETVLTGDVAAQAKAAAVAKVGGTADRASTETDSSNAAAAYEVHVTKSDGSRVVVILDKSDNVLSVETGPSGGRHGDGGHDGFRR